MDMQNHKLLCETQMLLEFWDTWMVNSVIYSKFKLSLFKNTLEKLGSSTIYCLNVAPCESHKVKGLNHR